MRWLSFLAVSLMAAGSRAAQKSSADRYETYRAKSLKTNPVKIVDRSYKELTTAPRDYSSVVMLTAMDPRYGCALCRDFQPEWELLARSWAKGDKNGDSRLVFATLDFADGRETFVALGLQTAPVLMFFPPTTGPHAAASAEPVRFDFTSGGAAAEVVQNWLARNMPDRPHPMVKRPINWFFWIVSATAVTGLFTAVWAAWHYVRMLVWNRNLWAALSLIAILLFTSGHMFNHIRKVPYVAGDGKGGVSYFAGGFQNQFGMETQIIAALYGVLSFATISLAVKVPRMADPNAQWFATAAWGGVMLLAYSFLLSIFRMKNGGYPYYLPPFM